jgi:hypothetical protein
LGFLGPVGPHQGAATSRNLVEVDDLLSERGEVVIVIRLARRMDEEVVVPKRLVVALRELRNLVGLEGGEEATNLQG